MKFLTLTVLNLLLLFASSQLLAQCENWEGKPNEDELFTKHSNYQDYLKKGDFDKAYAEWNAVFSEAPAANGKTAIQFQDGRKIYQELFKAATDDTQKEDFKNKALALYEAEYSCFPKDKKGKDKRAYLLEVKAYEMYYIYNTPRSETYEVIKEAVDLSGNSAGYVIMYPYADLVAEQYEKGNLNADQFLEMHKKVNGIIDHGIKNSKQYSAYYQQAKDQVATRFEPLKEAAMGCDYYLPAIQEKYDALDKGVAMEKRRDDLEVIYNELLGSNCGKEVALVNSIYNEINGINQQIGEKNRQEALENNPFYVAIQINKEAKALESSGDKSGAKAKFEEAIAKFEEVGNVQPERKHQALYYIATIYGYELNQYSKARSYANKAANAKPDYGMPYILIGNLYAKSANSIGKTNSEANLVILAALAKYRKALSVSSDPDERQVAQERINRYSGYKADCGELFQAIGKNKGDAYRIGGWIGETVTISCN